MKLTKTIGDSVIEFEGTLEEFESVKKLFFVDEEIIKDALHVGLTKGREELVKDNVAENKHGLVDVYVHQDKVKLLLEKLRSGEVVVIEMLENVENSEYIRYIFGKGNSFNYKNNFIEVDSDGERVYNIPVSIIDFDKTLGGNNG